MGSVSSSDGILDKTNFVYLKQASYASGIWIVVAQVGSKEAYLDKTNSDGISWTKQTILNNKCLLKAMAISY